MDASVSLEGQMFVLAVAREGNFRRAAKKLRIAQPALTRKISAIEKQLGAKLFKRGNRDVELTAAGKLFVPEAQASVLHAKRAFGLARQQGRIESGPLRLGVASYVHSDLLPLLHRWELEDKGISRKLVLESGVTQTIIERVLNGSLHVGLGVMPIADEQLWVTPVAREPLCVCIPKNHRLAQKSNASVQDLHGEIVFWFPRVVHPGFYDQTVDYIQGQGVQPVFHQVGSGSQAMEIVSHGFGLTLLPRSFSRFSHTGIVFKALTDVFLKIETALFVRQDQRRELLQEQMRVMFSELRTFCPNL